MLTYFGIGAACWGGYRLYQSKKENQKDDMLENIVLLDRHDSSLHYVLSFLESAECHDIFKESEKLLHQVIRMFVENKEAGGIGYNQTFKSSVYSYQIKLKVSQTEIAWEVLDFSIKETEPSHLLFSVIYDRYRKESEEQLCMLQKNNRSVYCKELIDLCNKADVPYLWNLHKQLHNINEAGWNRGLSSIQMPPVDFAKVVSAVESIKKGYHSHRHSEIRETLERILELSDLLLQDPFLKELEENEAAYNPFADLIHLLEVKVIHELHQYKLLDTLHQDIAYDKTVQSLQFVCNHFDYFHQKCLIRQKQNHLINTTEMMIQERYYC